MTRKVSTPAAYKLMHDGALALADVEANGICIDHVYLAKATKMIKRRIKLNDEKLRKSKVYSKWRRMYGAKTNLDSGKQLSHVLDLPDSQETTLEALGSKFTKAYLRNKKYKKLLSTQLLGIRREMYRVGNKWFISPFFNLHLVRTYRSSSDRINFQNIPIRDEELAEIVRQIFIPRASNRVIIEIDYGGIEVKIAACYHKDPVMLDYLNDPTKDMHTDTASQCYKIKKSDVTKKVRHAAKNQFVFPEFYGSVYQQCAPAMWESITRRGFAVESSGLGLMEHLATKGITSLGKCEFDSSPIKGTFEYHLASVEKDFWQKRFQVYAQWKRDWFDKYQRNAGFRTKTGFWIGGVMGRNDVINYPVQGAAFHCLLWSLIVLNERLIDEGYDAIIIGQIHDSIVLDVPVDEVDDVLRLAHQIMIEELRDEWDWIITPLEIEAEVTPPGRSWFEKAVTEICL